MSWRVAVERMPRTAGVNAGEWTERGNGDRRETATGDLSNPKYIYIERERGGGKCAKGVLLVIGANLILPFARRGLY